MGDPNFTLVQLRYFAAAAELGSMTGAAKQLMVSQSAVSTAVAQLERELGVQLLLRHHARGLTLTAAGAGFVLELRNFLGHASDLAEAARGLGQALVGDLKVGMFTTIAPFHLPRLLSRFEAEHPDVHVVVHEDEHAAVKAAIRDGSCEVAITYDFDLEDDLVTVELDEVPPYVIVSPDHRLAKRRRRSVALADLATEPMVLLDLPHSRDYFRSIMTNAGVEPVVRHRSSGYETVRSLVAHGHGYALLNQHPVHDHTYDGGSVVALELRDTLPPLKVVLVHARSARLTNRAQAFTNTCRLTYDELRRAR